MSDSSRELRVEAHDGTRLYARIFGEGPPIVLCDGVGCDGFIWRYLAEVLARNMTVVRWHYRGHGRSEPPRDPEAVHIEDHVADLVSVLDAVGIDRAVLAGHSMGVQVILEAWRQHKARIDAYVLLCGSYQRPLDTFQYAGNLHSVIFPLLRQGFARPDSWLTRAWRRFVATEAAFLTCVLLECDGRRIRRDDMWPYLEHLRQMPPDLFLRFVEAAQQHSTADLLDAIDVPTLIVAGEHDRFTPMKVSETMHEAIRGSELHVVSGGSHVAPLEAPDEVERIVVSFLERHGLVRPHADVSPPPRPRDGAGQLDVQQDFALEGTGAARSEGRA